MQRHFCKKYSILILMIVFLLMAALAAYLILKHLGAALIGELHLKERRPSFKVRGFILINLENFVIFPFQITICNYHYDLQSLAFHNY